MVLLCRAPSGSASIAGGAAMGDVIQFKKPSPFDKHKGKTLCRSGFHKWQVVKEKQFDVKQGKLVTVYKCTRCGEQKVELK